AKKENETLTVLSQQQQKRRSMYVNIYNSKFLFFNLAKGLVWTDLLGIIFTTPSVVAAYVNRGWTGGNIHCSFHVDVRTKGQKRCIVLIWMFVVGFGILPFIGVGLFTKQYPGTWCFLDFHSHKILVKIYAFLYACINIILILLMIVFNSFVVCCLAQRRFLRKPKRKKICQYYGIHNNDEK
ncbi:PE2R4-like protein, partial [Mya arenaria]